MEEGWKLMQLKRRHFFSPNISKLPSKIKPISYSNMWLNKKVNGHFVVTNIFYKDNISTCIWQRKYIKYNVINVRKDKIYKCSLIQKVKLFVEEIIIVTLLSPNLSLSLSLSLRFSKKDDEATEDLRKYH